MADRVHGYRDLPRLSDVCGSCLSRRRPVDAIFKKGKYISCLLRGHGVVGSRGCVSLFSPCLRPFEGRGRFLYRPP